MMHGSLFSGIGGFDLAAQWMDWQNLFHCELNPFGQKVLKYYWPDAESFNDITKTDFTKYANRIDVLSGGFPCQPFSVAGERKGTADTRYLWPEMLRSIHEIAPCWVVGENVRGLVSWSGGLVFNQVCADLEALGYEVFPVIIPASGVNAPHKRERIWFIAHSNSSYANRFCGNGSSWEQVNKKEWEGIWGESGNTCPQGTSFNTNNEQLQRGLHQERSKQAALYTCSLNASFDWWNPWTDFPTQSPVCGRNDGLSPKLAGITVSKHRNESIKAYGNAVVPQVVYQIFKAIEQYEQQAPMDLFIRATFQG